MVLSQVIAIVNGQQVTLTYNASSGKWEGTITAPTKSSNRMKRDDSITGTISGSDLLLNVSTASDQDLNYTTVYKNGVPISDVSVTWISSTQIKVLNRTDTGGWSVEYRTASPVDGGTNGKYNVYIEATDQAGNKTIKSLDASTLVTVKEKTAPTITGLSPSSGAKINTAVPTISGNFSDNDSGIKTSTFQLVIDRGTGNERVINPGAPGLTLTTSGFSYVPQTALSEGTHTFDVTIADNDGNSTISSSISFTVDTIPPSLNVTAPTDGLITNNASCTVTGTTESTATVTIKLNGADQGTVTNTAGSFSKTITLAAGVNTIVVRATDAAGNYSEVARTVTLDTVAPTITAVEITPNPVDGGATLTIKVTVSDS